MERSVLIKATKHVIGTTSGGVLKIAANLAAVAAAAVAVVVATLAVAAAHHHTLPLRNCSAAGKA